jgi:type VI secretion system lysozyme-like protein
MSAHSLLGRIRDPSTAGARRAISDEELRVVVMESLLLLLTSRAGSALACPEYGMMSVVDVVHSCPDALATVAKSIKLAIERYEPRLASVSVRPLPHEAGGELSLRFEMTAQLVNGPRRIPVRFETQIDAARRLKVK